MLSDFYCELLQGFPGALNIVGQFNDFSNRGYGIADRAHERFLVAAERVFSRFDLSRAAVARASSSPSRKEVFASRNERRNFTVKSASKASSGVGSCAQRLRISSATLTPSRFASSPRKRLNSLVVKMVTRSVFTSKYYHDNAHAAKPGRGDVEQLAEKNAALKSGAKLHDPPCIRD
jgi:hypothetical protein